MTDRPRMLRMREGKPGGGKGPLLTTDLSLTLSTHATDVLFQPVPAVLDTQNAGLWSQEVAPQLNGLTHHNRTPLVAQPSPSHPGSQAEADWISASSAPDGPSSATPRSTPTQAPFSPSDGPASSTWETSGHWQGGSNQDQFVAPWGTSPTLAFTSSHHMGHHEPKVLLGSTPPSGQAGRPARTSPSPASGQDWQEPGQDSPASGSTLWDDTDLARSSSRTSLASSPLVVGWTGSPSSVNWRSSGMWGPTGFSTRSGSECPSDDDGCGFSPSTLTDILTPTAPPRYSLSARAAEGIMRRSAKRGRRLPAELDEALASLTRPSAPNGASSPVDRPETSTTTSSWTVRRLTPLECERLQGWPDGWTIVRGWSSRSTRSAADPTTTKPRRATS